jgi:hypothetical protein
MGISFSPQFRECREKLHIHEDNIIDAVQHYDKKQELSMNGLCLVLYSKKQKITQSYILVCGTPTANGIEVNWGIAIPTPYLKNLEHEDPLLRIWYIVY